MKPGISLIVGYFYTGLKYSNICAILEVVHGYIISVRQLKRILQKYSLKRGIAAVDAINVN